MDPILRTFHPAVASWFDRRFPAGPTQPQRSAWPRIQEGGDVLVASPTGTGKTLTGFLVAIDAAYRAHAAALACPATIPDTLPATDEPEPPPAGPGVVYVSPLRALAVDVRENLEIPLAGISAEADRLGLSAPELSVAVRTGDTPAAERTAMRRSPPDLLVTTPESLYLLLTAASSRAILTGVHTVIVDEVHTLARDKRGSHLALTLERLTHLVAAHGGKVQRIGLSATQRPLSVVARLLSGADPTARPTTVVDCGHARDLDVSIELPDSELESVASGAQLGDVLDRIADHVLDHRTTLVFVNTRKMAERVAHQLALRLGAPDEDGPDESPGAEGLPEVVRTRPGGEGDPVDAALQVAAHHGSLSAARRRIVEQRLRAGDLRALVATASLELGIDVGPVELVCQIGSPRAIATFLQRVGRANHRLEGTPAGRLYPLTRDELVECTALLAGVRAGNLDELHPPSAPVDILAQQLVAEVAAAEECEVDVLFDLVRVAAPYGALTREVFDDVVDLVSWGITTGRGRRGAHLHHDAVNGRLRARRGARLAALTSGGAIPETGDYRVVLDPEGTTVGSVHEDFAVEATAGDIFLLGTHSWRVAKVETGVVRVSDAGDLPPSIPFWLGEAPARTAELSDEVSAAPGRARAVAGRRRRRGCPDPRQGAGRGVRGGRRGGGGLSRRGAGRPRRAAHPGPTGHRAGLRRGRGVPAHRARPVRGPGQPRARPGPPQALLRLVRLRAPGRRRRRHGGPLARAPAQLPVVRRPAHAPEPDRARGAHPGGPAPPDARRPMAVEPHPLAGRPTVPRREAPPDPPAADGGGRPARRRLAGPGRLPGERRRRTGRGARPRPGAADHPRLSHRAARCDRAGGAARGPRVGEGGGALRRVGRAVPPPTGSSPASRTPISTGRRSRSVGAGPFRCPVASRRWAPPACRPGSRSTPPSSAPSTVRPQRRCSTRCNPGRAAPTSSTTCCSRWC